MQSGSLAAKANAAAEQKVKANNTIAFFIIKNSPKFKSKIKRAENNLERFKSI